MGNLVSSADNEIPAGVSGDKNKKTSCWIHLLNWFMMHQQTEKDK